MQGHGETRHDRIGRARLQRDRQGARLRQLHRRKARPARSRTIPADASVLVIAGPKTDFLAPEIDMLKSYLAKGGKLLVLLDPPKKATRRS